MPPKILFWLLIAVGLIYLLVPMDLIPDYFGLPGRLDDLVWLGVLAWFYRKHVRQYVQAQAQQQARPGAQGSRAGQAPPSARPGPGAFDARAVLGVGRSASREEVRAAYRARMQEYHPDKVAHLGADLQALAHEKAQEIQRAYRQLQR